MQIVVYFYYLSFREYFERIFQVSINIFDLQLVYVSRIKINQAWNKLVINDCFDGLVWVLILF